jgi:hypothetical protein
VVDWLIALLCAPFTLITLLPIPVWLGVAGGKKWDNFINIFLIPFGLGGLFNIPLE